MKNSISRPATFIAGGALALALMAGGPKGAWAAPGNTLTAAEGDQTTANDKTEIIIKEPIITKDPPKKK